ncbi:Tubulin Polyglutamylase Ttll11 [Manis pentadactyla]|nr:Tubulin Polyglutamylase Ttll11 [Manis pentadactyla]
MAAATPGGPAQRLACPSNSAETLKVRNRGSSGWTPIVGRDFLRPRPGGHFGFSGVCVWVGVLERWVGLGDAVEERSEESLTRLHKDTSSESSTFSARLPSGPSCEATVDARF